MSSKNSSLIFLVLLLFLKVYAQAQVDTGQLKQVRIGEKVPDYNLVNLINYPHNTVKVSDFKGKILILDFWTFSCSACIASWPKLHALKKEFGEKIEIILLNIYERSENVKAFLDKQERVFGRKLTLPVACGDKQLKELFPHGAVPHVIFIDQSGFLKYIDGGAYLNKETIQNMLDGKGVRIPEKTDQFSKVNWSKPLFMKGNITSKEDGNNAIWTSVINRYSPDMILASKFGNWEGSSYGWISNYPIKDMFRILYSKTAGNGKDVQVQNGLVVFQDVDTSGLVYQVNGIVKPGNRYVIQVTSDRYLDAGTIKRRMIRELEACFQLKTAWEKRIIKCMVVSRSDTPLNEYREGERLLKSSNSLLDFNDVTVAEIIERLPSSILSMYKSPYPLIDETNFKGKLGRISFEGDTDDWRVLNSVFNQHGLKLSVEERQVEVLVISSDI